MTTWIALLRGINVGGRKKVAMADLRAFVSGLGFDDAKTSLQSGNLVFRAASSGDSLEAQLEREAKQRLGLETKFLLRTAREWRSVVARNPYPSEAKTGPSRLLVTFLKAKPKAVSVKALEAAVVGSEYLQVAGREAYIVYPDGVGRSRLTNAVIEKKLETSATARNWNTVLKLADLAEA